MTTRLNQKERENMLKILNKDFDSIHATIMEQFEKLWTATRTEIEGELGFGTKLAEIAKLEGRISELQHKVNEIQRSMKEYAETPELVDYEEAGIGMPNHRNGYVNHHNVEFMGRDIHTKMDLKIAKRLRENMDPMKPIRMLKEIAESSIRAVVMSGTFEDARDAYKTFYSLDWHRYGVQIPRLLGEIKAVAGATLLTAEAKIVPALPAPVQSDPPKQEEETKDNGKEKGKPKATTKT